MPPPFPLPKGVFNGAEGEWVLFLVRIPSALAMGGIGHELSRWARHFLCAYHMNQVWRLYEYKSGVSDKIIPKPAFSATETR